MTGLGPGDRIGNYEIKRELGRGGMGVVYEARQRFPDRRVALKILSPDVASDPDFRKRFMRESQMAAETDHPHILPIYEAGEADGVLFISMRFVAGSDLGLLIRAEGPLTLPRALDLLDQVASALDAAHAEGLIHRDVKPANILISPASPSGREHAYLTDFGLTKRGRGSTALTRSGQFVGTLDYIAPEQIKGETTVGPHTDIYALGCVAFESLTGSPPFARDTDVALIYAHLQEPPPHASDLRTDIPISVNAVIARAMAKEWEERPVSARELVRELREAIEAGARLLDDTRPAATRPRQPRPGRLATKQSTKPKGRRRAALLASLALVAAGATVTGATLLATNDGSAPLTTTSPAGPSPRPTSASPTPSPSEEDTGVVAERPSQVNELFDEVIQAKTPWFNDIEDLYTGYPLDHAVAEASLISAWWALADWCATTKRPLESCYDLGAEYIDQVFGRDPRTINTDTWSAPGAIGGVIVEGYDRTASYLGIPMSGLIPELTEDRPGMAWLCEPSCVEAPHD